MDKLEVKAYVKKILDFAYAITLDRDNNLDSGITGTMYDEIVNYSDKIINYIDSL